MGEENLVGRRVGNWTLERLLGEGAFGAVYQAVNAGIAGKHAAVKVLHPHLAMHPSVKQRFLNEASAASRADHENIVQIFDGGITDEGYCYSVMELLRGRTLSSVLSAGAMDAPRVVNIGVQVAGALAAAHELGIVHRDLKPDNLFIVERAGNREFVKVLDFGVAKLQDPGGEKLTKTGMLIGTPGYMSPEQWKTLPDIDGRADIYALGVILYECACGRLPFSGNTPYEWLRAHLEDPVPDLAATGNVEPGLWRVISRMLEKEREKRPQSMVEVLSELEAARVGLARAGALPYAPTFAPVSSAVSAVPISEARPRTTLGDAAAEAEAIERPQRSRAPIFVGAGIAILALAGGAYALFGRGAPTPAVVEKTAAPDLGNAVAVAPVVEPKPTNEEHHAVAHHESVKHEVKTAKAGSDEKTPPEPPGGLPHLPTPVPPATPDPTPVAATPPASGKNPPPAPAAPTGASSPEAQRILDDAQQEYVVGHYQSAIAKARSVLDRDPVAAYKIIGIANCMLGEQGRAHHAFNNTDANSRNLIKYTCSKQGITLP
jgi:serine/threonine-protein kinase